MKITYKTLGIAQTNTYYIEHNGSVIVCDPCLDPGYDARRLLKPIENKNVVGVIITHGHFDHISGIDAVVNAHGCPVYMFHEEVHWTRNASKNLSLQFGEPITVESAIQEVKLGRLEIGDFTFEVIKTPGHTAGSVSYVIDNHILDGDFIMNMGVGRTDLPTGSMVTLTEALTKFVSTYRDKQVILYPGHGDVCFLDEEILYNPYLKRL